MSQETQIQVEKSINASPSQIYYAFTNSTALREWMCDFATTDPKAGGRLYLWWNGGFYVCAEFTSLEGDKTIAFTWKGRPDPGPTQVKASLSKQGERTHVILIHSGIGTSDEWKAIPKEFLDEWTSSLENLASVLETGQDLRFVRRPMLGISIGDYNPEVAARLGIPVTEGLRLDSTLEGMGAYAAGLRKDDVVVSMAGQAVTNYPTLVTALQSKHAGEKIEVEFFRGNQRKTVTMELSRRPLPDIPGTAKELAEAVRKIYTNQDIELDQCFAGVSEKEADHRPAKDEWGAKEVVAHLIHSERGTLIYMDGLIGGQEQWSDDDSGNQMAHIQATVSTFPTIPDLLNELKHLHAEILAYITNLPVEFVARKGSYWRLAYLFLEGNFHPQGHYAQIRSAIADARKR